MQPEVVAQRRTVPASLDDGALRGIYESGIVGVAVWERTGRISQANQRFLDLMGYQRHELEAGRLDWQRLGRHGEQPLSQCMPERLAGVGNAVPIFNRYTRADGSPVFVRVHSTSLGSGKTLSIVVDVTEQRKAQDERDALLLTERAARAEAEAAVRSREDILAIVSHDLRNPLSTISMSLSLMEAAQPDERSRTQAAIIRRAIANMTRLIQDLLELNQIAAGQLVIRPQVVAVSSVLEDSRSAGAAVATCKKQCFEVLPGDCGEVMADGDRVAQVLANLISNAAKFTPEGGRITVSTHAMEREVRFCVTDTGPGIEAQDLPHIFDRFWQARRVRRGGVGLGLAISKGIVEAHGGRIWARSNPGFGSSFFFTLPRPR